MSDRDRLPPRQKAVPQARVINIATPPQFDPQTWTLEVDGLVERPLRLSWQELLDRVDYDAASDFHCVEGWSVLGVRWEGVRLGTLLAEAGVKPEARFIFIECSEGYTTSVPVEDGDDPDVVLAVKQDGRWLEPENGRPVRLVVPHRYAYKAAKFVSRITLLAEDRLGYWELRGYHNEADPWKEQRRA